MGKLFLAFAVGLLATSSAQAQSTLALVDKAELGQLKANCRWLVASLDRLKMPLPDETRATLEKLVSQGADNADTLVAIQEVLDPLCIVGVSINPESRVKAARGPSAAELLAGAPRVYLIKVHNEAGVTEALRLTGPHLAESKDSRDKVRWLQALTYRSYPKGTGEKLSGNGVEYLMLVCTAHEPGKREAKLIFDVGQGTQDLGFRAEVPILFSIKPKQ